MFCGAMHKGYAKTVGECSLMKMCLLKVRYSGRFETVAIFYCYAQKKLKKDLHFVLYLL